MGVGRHSAWEPWPADTWQRAFRRNPSQGLSSTEFGASRTTSMTRARPWTAPVSISRPSKKHKPGAFLHDHAKQAHSHNAPSWVFRLINWQREMIVLFFLVVIFCLVLLLAFWVRVRRRRVPAIPPGLGHTAPISLGWDIDL